MKQQSISFAVLPFTNLTGMEEDYFIRGFVEDIIIDLSRFTTLKVISPNTSLNLDIEDDQTNQKAREFHIDYYLSGSYRHSKKALRINTRLIKTEDDKVVWAERYDAGKDRIFEILEDIVEKIVGILHIKITSAQLAEARRKPITQLGAYDCWLRGNEFLRKGTIEDDEKARELFNHALEIDPHYGRAHAGISLSYFNEWSCQLWEEWDYNERMAYENAKNAIHYDESDHIAHLILGRILIYRREFDQAAYHFDKSLAINANDANALIQIGSYMAYLGRTKEGIELFGKAISLNPYYPEWYYVFGMMTYIQAREHEEVIKMKNKVSDYLSVDTPAFIAAAYARLGDLSKAMKYRKDFEKGFNEKIAINRQAELGEGLRWVLHVNPMKKAEDVAYFSESLVMAGFTQSTDEPMGVPTGNKLENDEQITTNRFRKANGFWELNYQNKWVSLPEVKGFYDISVLLHRPLEKIHVGELIGSNLTYSDEIETIDFKAKEEYKNRILELQADLEEAEEMNDAGRISVIREELDQLIDFLSQSLGKGNKPRKIASVSERARSAVTWRIRSAIGKIEIAHPELAKHLSNSIRTGAYCSYSPEKKIPWQL